MFKYLPLVDKRTPRETPRTIDINAVFFFGGGGGGNGCPITCTSSLRESYTKSRDTAVLFFSPRETITVPASMVYNAS